MSYSLPRFTMSALTTAKLRNSSAVACWVGDCMAFDAPSGLLIGSAHRLASGDRETIVNAICLDVCVQPGEVGLFVIGGVREIGRPIP